MTESDAAHIFRRYKNDFLDAEFSGCLIIIILIVWLEQFGIITIPFLTCTIPPLTGTYEWTADLPKAACYINDLVQIAGAVCLTYMIACILMIASSLRAAPIMLLTGLYLTRARHNDRPETSEAITLFLFNPEWIARASVLVYFAVHDFKVDLNDQYKTIYIIFAALFLIRTIRLFLHGEKWSEASSGLTLHLTDKAREKLNEKLRKRKTLPRFWYIFGIIFGLVSWGAMGINALREGTNPPDYFDMAYSRPAPAWDGNGAIALKAVFAPPGVDAYASARTDMAALANDYNLALAYRGIDYAVPLPYGPHAAAQPYNPLNSPRPIIVPDWSCHYSLADRRKTTDCPPVELSLKATGDIPVIWARFLSLADSTSFTPIPNLEERPGTLLGAIKPLARLNASYLVATAASGDGDKAIKQWTRFTGLYLSMLRAAIEEKDNIIDLVEMQIDTLETMVQYNPRLAEDHAPEILDVLNYDSISAFRAGDIVADNWRVYEPVTILMKGTAANAQKKALACYMDNKRAALLSAAEFFSLPRQSLCSESYPRTLHESLFAGLFGPGVFTNNLEYALFNTGNAQRAQNTISRMHILLADMQLARTAVQLIARRETAPASVPKALEDLSRNPLDGAPFQWYPPGNEIYFDNPANHRPQTFRLPIAALQSP